MEKRDRLIGFLFSDIARFRGIIFENLMRPHGLTHAQAYVLNQLFLEDGLSQTELAARMNVGTVTVSGLLDRLETRGWVRRSADTRDRRAKNVWLTESAAGLLDHMVREFTTLNDIATAGLSEDEVVQMSNLLRKVRSNLAAELGQTK
ncbi:MarR family transcriptional regulator [Sulfitobacter sp. F26169L]|uniref:MarR family winged helix-turn-helix transcriptional regulator n=1 Tax=Sulfitobacter sp. F26169L TaxID=2996015 RepID=UPI002260B1B8|nr:MarR family transcriptional regulator [Sulfitobacter sp. F26169L]MCX7568115.1 MarR family transcriptional regulator [Sulfitobacter sp. F26169L]